LWLIYARFSDFASSSPPKSHKIILTGVWQRKRNKQENKKEKEKKEPKKRIIKNKRKK